MNTDGFWWDIKQLLDEFFVISRIVKVEIRVISRSRRLRLITLTETLIILDITKTESNNCFIIPPNSAFIFRLSIDVREEIKDARLNAIKQLITFVKRRLNFSTEAANVSLNTLFFLLFSVFEQLDYRFFEKIFSAQRALVSLN